MVGSDPGEMEVLSDFKRDYWAFDSLKPYGDYRDEGLGEKADKGRRG